MTHYRALIGRVMTLVLVLVTAPGLVGRAESAPITLAFTFTVISPVFGNLPGHASVTVDPEVPRGVPSGILHDFHLAYAGLTWTPANMFFEYFSDNLPFERDQLVFGSLNGGGLHSVMADTDDFLLIFQPALPNPTPDFLRLACRGCGPITSGQVIVTSSSVVPEPSSLLLLSGGLVALARCLRRKPRP
jgi:hypothetical protein